MKKYNKEWQLAKEVCAFLRSRDFFVQRIESGKTGVGIPDVYWTKDDTSGWIELKIVKAKFMGTSKGIRWQQGQQHWMINHNKHSDTCVVLIAYTDCYVLLEMNRFYEDGEPLEAYISGKTLKEVLL